MGLFPRLSLKSGTELRGSTAILSVKYACAALNLKLSRFPMPLSLPLYHREKRERSKRSLSDFLVNSEIRSFKKVVCDLFWEFLKSRTLKKSCDCLADIERALTPKLNKKSTFFFYLKFYFEYFNHLDLQHSKIRSR